MPLSWRAFGDNYRSPLGKKLFKGTQDPIFLCDSRDHTPRSKDLTNNIALLLILGTTRDEWQDYHKGPRRGVLVVLTLSHSTLNATKQDGSHSITALDLNDHVKTVTTGDRGR